jgi:ubiquinone/menaquinone biosynthesis C-methylase UbiE
MYMTPSGLFHCWTSSQSTTFWKSVSDRVCPLELLLKKRQKETMVQAARTRNIETIQAGQMELKQGDVASLSYPDETFDKAFSIHSIYFWAKPIECLQELRRVLKPGGLLAITIQPKDKWSELQQRETSLRTLYFSADLVTMFDAAGFREVRIEVSPEPEQFSGECVLGIK